MLTNVHTADLSSVHIYGGNNGYGHGADERQKSLVGINLPPTTKTDRIAANYLVQVPFLQYELHSACEGSRSKHVLFTVAS